MIDLFPNETVLYQWFLFMVALVTLNWGIFRPVLRILEERKKGSSGARAEAKGLEERVMELSAVCEKKLDEARLSGAKKKAEIRQMGERHVEELLKKTRQETDAKMTEVHASIEAQARETSLKLKQYSQELAREITSKVLEREI